MKALLIAALHNQNNVRAQRAAAIARLAFGIAGGIFMLVDPAAAQTLKATGTTIFTAIYGIVGIVGAICLLISGMNWATGNWLGRDDPKKTFFHVLMGTGIAFASVAIVQFLKETIGADAAGISNL